VWDAATVTVTLTERELAAVRHVAARAGHEHLASWRDGTALLSALTAKLDAAQPQHPELEERGEPKSGTW
jgi:hypothetical protein